jgi:uncharacterized protein (TIGR00288 family)
LEHRLAVLIDFENIAAGTEKEGLGKFDIRAVIRRLKDKGRILVNRSYGDWGRFAKFKQRLLEQGVTMVELTSYRGQDKNRADIALVVDAMEIAFTRDYIDTFVLMSGDSDFTPLVMRLKELDRRVIGIGTRGSSSRLLVDSCDEFIFSESLLKQAKQARQAGNERQADRTPDAEAESSAQPPVESGQPESGENSEKKDALSKSEAFELLVETLSGFQKDAPGPVLGGLIKQSMLRKEPSFDETEYGYSGFARFLEAARGRELVQLNRDQKAGGYRVDLPDSEDADPEDVVVKRGRSNPAGEIEDLEEGVTVEIPVLEGPARVLHDALAAAGVVPVSHMARHTVVHEFVDHIQERERRRKRNTLQYVYGDIARRCRKTDPFMPTEQVRAVINAIKKAGLMKHTSGGPVRSQNAHFVVKHDPDEILVALRRLYITLLLDAGVSLDNSSALSELLWNDEEHAQEAEELVAWMVHDRSLRESDHPAEVPDAADEAPVGEE